MSLTINILTKLKIIKLYLNFQKFYFTLNLFDNKLNTALFDCFARILEIILRIFLELNLAFDTIRLFNSL